jgi:hypothetical protein
MAATIDLVRDRGGFLRGAILAAALSAIFAVWVESDLGGARATVVVDDLATVGAVLLATIFCVMAARRHTGTRRVFWWLLAGGCGAWSLGETIWGAYDLGPSGGVPEVSWADAAYLAALPPVALALLMHPALRGRAIRKSRSLVDGLLLAAAVFLLGWTVVLEPIGRTADLTSLGGVVTLAYPFGDAVIVFLVVMVIRGTTDRDRLALWCLLAGLLAISFSDTGYGYLSNLTQYSSGKLIDTGWFAGYLAIALAARSSRSESRPEPRAEAAPSLTTAALVAPFVPMIGALGFLAIRIARGQALDDVTLTFAFILVALVLVRQALVIVDLLFVEHEHGERVPDRLLEALGAVTTGRVGS